MRLLAPLAVLALLAPAAVAPHGFVYYKQGFVLTHDGPVPGILTWDADCGEPGWAKVDTLVPNTPVEDRFGVEMRLLQRAPPGPCLYTGPAATEAVFQLRNATLGTDLVGVWQARQGTPWEGVFIVEFAGTYRGQPSAFVIVLKVP